MLKQKIMQKNQKINFIDFLESFPEVELPVILGENTHLEFSRRNPPIPTPIIHTFIEPLEDDFDEFTEIIACFRVAKTHDFHAVVYWKAGLLNYQYILATFEKNGRPIDRAVVAGMYTDGDVLTQSVANFEEDWMIHIVSGQLKDGGKTYDATTSRKVDLELLPDGRIVVEE